MEQDRIREEIFDWFGDHELWVGLLRKGDVFSASPNKCFARDVCFSVFLYDPASCMIALRPKPGMHADIVDNYQALPSRGECKDMVWNTEGGVVTYRCSERDVEDHAPEIIGYSDVRKFVKEYPDALDLLK